MGCAAHFRLNVEKLFCRFSALKVLVFFRLIVQSYIRKEKCCTAAGADATVYITSTNPGFQNRADLRLLDELCMSNIAKLRGYIHIHYYDFLKF